MKNQFYLWTALISIFLLFIPKAQSALEAIDNRFKSEVSRFIQNDPKLVDQLTSMYMRAAFGYRSSYGFAIESDSSKDSLEIAKIFAHVASNEKEPLILDGEAVPNNIPALINWLRDKNDRQQSGLIILSDPNSGKTDYRIFYDFLERKKSHYSIYNPITNSREEFNIKNINLLVTGRVGMTKKLTDSFRARLGNPVQSDSCGRILAQ